MLLLHCYSQVPGKERSDLTDHSKRGQESVPKTLRIAQQECLRRRRMYGLLPKESLSHSIRDASNKFCPISCLFDQRSDICSLYQRGCDQGQASMILPIFTARVDFLSFIQVLEEECRLHALPANQHVRTP
jgi:hypothetical protein